MKAIMVKDSIVSLEIFLEAKPISQDIISVRYTTGYLTTAGAFAHHSTTIDTKGLDRKTILNKIYEIVTEK